MKIDNKFKIGDKCWTMSNNVPTIIKINLIAIYIKEDDIEIKYHDGYSMGWYYEHEIFSSKEDLKNSLFG